MRYQVVFHPDGRQLAVATWGGPVLLLDAESRRELLVLQAQANSLAFSPDGRRLATGSWDRLVRLWDVATGRQAVTLHGHTGDVEGVAFSRDGRRWFRVAGTTWFESGTPSRASRS